MSKKKKKLPTKPKNSTLQAQADYLLEKQFYKEAVEVYKKLLKQEERQEWREKLAMAYLGRAKALAEKGMYKEAVVFWESRDNLCNDKACFSEYIAWLALAGRSPKALRLFISHPIDDEQNQQLSVVFATLLLAGDAELIAALPPESILYQHYQIIKEALLAYYQGHDDTVKVCLKKIPFRSPYRDFANILRALITLDIDSQNALALIRQVPVSSPFNGFARLIEMSLLPTEILVEQMNDLTAPEQTLIAHLKGWDKTQMRIISSLQSAVKRDCSTKALFDAVMTNRTFFGNEYSRRFCLALLPDYAGGVKRYEKMFGNLSVFEKTRITALSYERRGKMEESDQEWQKCVDILKRHADQGDNILKAALILRHLAEKWLAHSNESEIVVDYLIESLCLDPDDKASYHRILELHDNKNESLAVHESWIMAGVERFPHDRELLLAAITIARGEENFDQAIQLAETLAKIDPTSARAKQIVLACYLDFIRELMQGDEYKQVPELFDQLVQRYPCHSMITINQGLYALKKGEMREAKTLLLTGIEQSGNDICGQFRLMAEVALMQIEWKTVSSLVPLPTRRRTYSPTQQEIIALIKVVGEYYAEYSYIFTEELVKPLQSPLKKACTLPFTTVERVNVCRLLGELGDYKLLKQYAKAGITQYPDYHPAFTYFEIYAETKGDAEELSHRDMYLLEEAIDTANRENDKLTSTMIIDFFRRGLLAHIPFRFSQELERALSESDEQTSPDDE